MADDPVMRESQPNLIPVLNTPTLNQEVHVSRGELDSLRR
jgi:hypothetical protein